MTVFVSTEELGRRVGLKKRTAQRRVKELGLKPDAIMANHRPTPPNLWNVNRLPELRAAMIGE